MQTDPPTFNRKLARRYVAKASQILAGWHSLTGEERLPVLSTFAETTLPMFHLSPMRHLHRITNDLGALGRYVAACSLGVCRLGDGSEKDQHGAILLQSEIFELPYPTCAVEVFAHECVHAAQTEILGDGHPAHSGPILAVTEEDLKQKARHERQALDFQQLIGLEMKKRPRLFPDLPKKIKRLGPERGPRPW